MNVNFIASRFASATGDVCTWVRLAGAAGQRPGKWRGVQPAVSSMIGFEGSLLPRLAAETWGIGSSRELMGLR